MTFGDPAKLDLGQFTIETWFKRTGAGVAYQTSGGTGGIANAIPLVTHGASDADGSAIDANWMLVIDDATDVLAADFEDMASRAEPCGAGYHADRQRRVVSRGGHLRRHYLAPVSERGPGGHPGGQCHAAFGQHLPGRPGSVPPYERDALGHFQGVLDEARVWNYARSQAQIAADINNELTSGTGLVARWGMSESVGTVVGDSIAPANGTIIGTGVTRVAGAPFDLVVNLPPNLPTLVAPPDGATAWRCR